MASFIGIDLGTTYSAISYFDKSGVPTIIHNSEGDNITPSCISFDGDTVDYTGKEARKALGLDDDNVAARFKRDMGSSKIYTINGHKHTPTDLSAIILKRLLKDAKSVIGDIGQAVVTVPANFPNKARVETTKAAKMAKLNAKLIDEPTAAALYYAYQSGFSLQGNYVVYDLGGGTFDVSVVKLDGRDVNVLATDGIPRLGGDDFDTTLQEMIQKRYHKDTGEELEQIDLTKTAAEDYKKSLSKRDVKIRVVRENYAVTQDEFEEAISSRIAESEMICQRVLEAANLTIADIESVFLVGGSTRIPLVQQSVKRAFNLEPTATINVDEVVALGASIYAAIQEKKKGDQSELNAAQKAVLDKVSVGDVTPYYFGVIYSGADYNRQKYVDKVSIIIERNIPRPCSVTKPFVTAHDGQTFVRCTVTQSARETTDPDFVTKIWEGRMGPLPENRPAGQKISITFSYDDNGIMNADYLDVESGENLNIDISDIDEPGDEGKFDID